MEREEKLNSFIFRSSLCILFLIVISLALEGAYLRNVPVKVVQPNGLEIKVFASGDEFYNWLHDKNGFTIIQNPKTGYYVYAIEKDGDLLPSDYVVTSDYVVNRANLNYLNIHKYLKHSPEKRISPAILFSEGSPANVDKISPAPRTGTLNNIAIFIRFSDESEFTDYISTYEDMFNDNTSDANSMYNYFYEASYNQLETTTTFYPTTTSTVASYQDSQPRAYYQPYNEVTNPTGYQSYAERTEREHTLLKNAVDTVSSQIPSDLNVDADGDSKVDNVCFIIYGDPDGWNNLLWPHKWALHSKTSYINGKRVYIYNFQLQTSLSSSAVGVLCHEMFHSLGAPDLYHYYDHKELKPVYKWDLMQSNLNPPQHMGAYMKYRYGTWISSIPEITTAGTYTLNPLKSSVNNCYKIASPYSSTEYFMVEYRRKSGTFENSLPGEGLLVYRINTEKDGQGNGDGPPDEVYIYRPNGSTTQNGDPNSANFSSNVERTSINDTTNPSSFLSNGDPGGLDISYVSSASETISFNVTFPATYQLVVEATPDTGVDITVSPNDINSEGNGTTNFNRFYNIGSDVSLTAPSSFHGLSFLKWTLDGADYSTDLSIQLTMNKDKTVVASYGVDLGEAVDNSDLAWTTGGSSVWFGQTNIYFHDNDSVQSANLSNSQSTYLQTTVQGPGTLTFYWKVSSEEYYDYLNFYIDDGLEDKISGEVDWEQKYFLIGSGTHTLKWIYSKDSILSSGSDCAWLDKVEFVTGITPKISGSVKASGDEGVEGVTITFSNEGGTATTDSSGNYTHTVSYGWSGTATPSKTGYTFSPENRTYANITSDQTVQDYTATLLTYTISGNVSTGESAGRMKIQAGLSGVVMSGLPGNPQTDTDGNYSATVSYGWSGTATPTKAGYTFNPTSKSYDSVTSNQTGQDYNATLLIYTISGAATAGDSGLQGVEMSGLPGDPQTDADGNYSATVSYRWSGTVTPTKAGYTFLPSSRIYYSIIYSQSYQDYKATAITPAISGSVKTSAGEGVEGVTITFSNEGGTATTDSSGNYSHTVSYGWSGIAVPSKTGYSFNPTYKSYDSVTSDQTAQDYTATLLALPYISSISPIFGPTGTEVTISGSNFGSSQGTVTFNEVNASITSWSDTEIVTTIPDGASTGPVVVHTSDEKNSNEVIFAVVGEVAWFDGFEDYTPDSWPSTNWIQDANASDSANNYVDDTKYHSGANSLKMYGVVNAYWGALTYRPLNITPPFYIEAWIMNGSEQPTYGHTLKGCIGLRKGTSWKNPERYLITSSLDNNIVGLDWAVLGTYTSGVWFKVLIRYEVSGSSVLVSYWINDDYKAQVTVSAIPEETNFQLNNLELTAYSGSAWFDDVKVYASPNAPTISGSVKTSGDEAVEGVTITFSDGGGATTTDSSGNYSHPVSYGWSGAATPSKTGYTFSPVNRTYTSVISDQANQYYTAILTTSPKIYLSKSLLNFGSTTSATHTSSQQFIISNTGGGTLDWSISDDAAWLSCTPGSGTGNAVITASVDPTGLVVGTYTATMTISSTNASNSPRTINVTLTVMNPSATSLPFGYFDTPIDRTTGITGAIPVTGWSLDDIEVTRVEIKRDAHPDDPPAAVGPYGLVYIGDAVFVEGSRPDIEQAYPGYPFNYRAGWGYMLLTNFLPNQGNGTYGIHAIAYDKDGYKVKLGIKTITCDNANAILPFGTIDTPGQGGDASGSAFLNWGWVLTPQPNSIPTDGSTILVWVDGVAVGNVDGYNLYRADIATLFPGYANTDGAVGYYYLDTTPYSNGVYTLAWSAVDIGGNTQGIGSRYFTIINTQAAAQAGVMSRRVDLGAPLSFEAVGNLPLSFEPVRVRRGYTRETEPEVIATDNYGGVSIEIREVERVEVELGEGVYTGYMVVGDQLRPLPIGSTLDTENGIFFWQPGPGFVGEYDFVFIKKASNGEQRKLRIGVKIIPKFDLY